jgi:DNA primase large subunit
MVSQLQLFAHIISSPDLRDKFIRTELELFKQRFDSDDQHERSQFLKSLNFDWTVVDDSEKRMYEKQLKACMPWGAQRDSQFASESWVKVSTLLYQSDPC